MRKGNKQAHSRSARTRGTRARQDRPMTRRRDIYAFPTTAEIEALKIAAQQAIADFKAGKISQPEMHRRFWRCVSQIPADLPDAPPRTRRHGPDDGADKRSMLRCP